VPRRRRSAEEAEPVSDPLLRDSIDELAPVHAGEERPRTGAWTTRLVLFLRIMAGIAMAKGLYHWSVVCGIGAGPPGGFEAQTSPWQTATVFFAVIDLVAAVGLWLAAPWGAVVWLTGSVSMIVVHLFFPQIYGPQLLIVIAETAAIAVYLVLAIQAAREQPQ
jgi:hypothetical protein